MARGPDRAPRPLHAPVSRPRASPSFAFRLTETLPYSVFDISEALRSWGWLVPAYTLPPALEDVAVLRVVVRNGFSRDLAKMLLDDLQKVLSAGWRGRVRCRAGRRTGPAFTIDGRGRWSRC